MLETAAPSAPLATAFEPSPVFLLRFPDGDAASSLAVVVRERRVLVGPQVLDLARSPHMLSLFRGFCGAGARGLSAAHVLYFAYGVRDSMGASDRLVGSKRSCTVKLISRARILAETHLSGATCGRVEWFPYDGRDKVWRLAGVRPS